VKALAVSFDFGQTLALLDAELLTRRLAERGLSTEPARIEAAQPEAWRAYNEAIQQGYGGHPWKILMRAMLLGAGISASSEALGDAVDFLWDEQPKKNLWRSPVPGMLEVVADLRRANVPVGILSNSEGKLAELVDELGWFDPPLIIADSGKLGMEKPGREIFAWLAERLGTPLERVVHIGDAFAADVEGALGAGMLAIWFGGDPARDLGPRARVARDAAEVREALAAFGLPIVR
jgi:putative hydrolase of the HAD superfamily